MQYFVRLSVEEMSSDVRINTVSCRTRECVSPNPNGATVVKNPKQLSPLSTGGS